MLQIYQKFSHHQNPGAVRDRLPSSRSICGAFRVICEKSARSGLKKKELYIQGIKLALEEKRLASEMKEREAARQSQEATMNAMLGIIAKFAEMTQK